MTEDLTAKAGRVFAGRIDKRVGGPLQLYTVKRVRHRRDGTPSSCVLYSESPGVGGSYVTGEYNVRLPKDGKLHGLRRVTLANLGLAADLRNLVGETVPTDALVIVTNDRVPTATTPRDLFDT